MEINEKAQEIRDALQRYRESVNLTFTEEGHKYTIDGIDKIVSVSGIVSRYHESFDAEEVSLRMCDGDEEAAQELRDDWSERGRVARLTGNYVHYHLEKYLVDLFELDKEVREPILEGIDESMIKRGDNLIQAGKAQVQRMVDAGAVLVDTEVVMGSPKAGYVGQCDCLWLGRDKDGNFKLCLTDWKTNKPSKFSYSMFNKPMFAPFEDTPDNAVGKYSLQLGLYERLVVDMLDDPELVFSSSIIVSLRQRPKGSYKEFRLTDEMRQLIYNLEVC